MVKLGDAKHRIELIDGNVNGTFNDQSPDPSDCDRIAVEGDKTGQRYLGRLLEVDGELFQVEVARDGAFLKARKAEVVTLGQVRIPKTITEFVAVGPIGHFVRKPVDGTFTLPVGSYRIDHWTIDRKDDKGIAWTMMGYGFGESSSFTVAAGNPATIKVGEPIRCALQTTASDGQVNFNPRFLGPTGESIQMLRAGQQPPGPRLTLASSDGSFHYSSSFSFG
ncbi:MAG: hypothetical protein M1608_10690 [Candidatus Omnitrophica bacterium]|nr:hypothetical protein [Candidatus Omnitrophota bacterium]